VNRSPWRLAHETAKQVGRSPALSSEPSGDSNRPRQKVWEAQQDDPGELGYRSDYEQRSHTSIVGSEADLLARLAGAGWRAERHGASHDPAPIEPKRQQSAALDAV
jgi:hypothetical protein